MNQPVPMERRLSSGVSLVVFSTRTRTTSTALVVTSISDPGEAH